MYPIQFFSKVLIYTFITFFLVTSCGKQNKEPSRCSIAIKHNLVDKTTKKEHQFSISIKDKNFLQKYGSISAKLSILPSEKANKKGKEIKDVKLIGTCNIKNKNGEYSEADQNTIINGEKLSEIDVNTLIEDMPVEKINNRTYTLLTSNLKTNKDYNFKIELFSNKRTIAEGAIKFQYKK